MKENIKICTRTKDNKLIYCVTLRNDNMEAEILSIGAAIHSLLVPDKNGNPVDIVLGYNQYCNYQMNLHFFGAAVGRTAGRIQQSKFILNGKEYQLMKNDGDHCCHGGIGFSFRLWKILKCSKESVTMGYISEDGECGYPGTVCAKVSYTLKDRALLVHYEAETDKETPINMTCHAYWNLNGNGDILHHNLIVDADYICKIDSDKLPTGEHLAVDDTPFDFRKPKEIGSRISHPQLHPCGGYDHSYILNKKEPAAVLEGEDSKIRMKIITDAPILHVYTSNTLQCEQGKGGETYHPYAGICLEAQNYPDALHHPEFPSTVYGPDRSYHQQIIFQF